MTARILLYSPSSKSTLAVLSKMDSRWVWMVCESDAWPRISSSAGSDTKKKRGNVSRFVSR